MILFLSEENLFIQNNVILGDFKEYSKTLVDNFFDLIIVDPPYNIGAAKWDNIPNYFIWLKDILIAQYNSFIPFNSSTLFLESQ